MLWTVRKSEPSQQSQNLAPPKRLAISSRLVGCLLACLPSQEHTSVSQGQVREDNCTCCHTEIEAADQTFHLTQSQYIDTGPTCPSADPITPGAWQGSHWGANFEVTGMTRPRKIPCQAGFELRIFRSRGGRLNHQANEEMSARGMTLNNTMDCCSWGPRPTSPLWAAFLP